MAEPARSPLFDWHVAHRGRMVDFAGWSMPVQYSSIVAEHQATRQTVGLFDISHMGRIRFSGSAVAFLNRLLTRRVTSLQPTQVRYSLMCDENGGVLDDVLIYSVPDENDTPHYWLVVNAGNRRKILDWLQRQRGEDDVAWQDLTAETVMIAGQGPQAVAAAAAVIGNGCPLEQMPYYTARSLPIAGQPALLSRTGYTGEDGWELTAAADIGRTLWADLAAEVERRGGHVCGLGARDTLRLEAGMPLYGHELSASINPYEADLGFAVQLKDHEFIGKARLQQIRDQGPDRRRIGLLVNGRRPAREGAAVLRSGHAIGHVSSGTFSPTLQAPIAMAIVAQPTPEPGTMLEVDIRGTLSSAEVTNLPFYRRA